MSDQDIKAAQEAYAARPYAARVETSHFSGTFRFHTRDGAFDYIFDQYKRFRRQVAEGTYGRDWTNFDLYRSYVVGPDGQKMCAGDILMVG